MKIRANADSTSSGANEGWAVLTTLLGGFAVWGGVGWLLDRWWHTHVALPIGVLLGMVLGIYAVVKRYGQAPTGVQVPPASDQSPWVAPFESRLIRVTGATPGADASDRTDRTASAGKETR